MEILHTAIWVSDLEDTKRFYEEGLGLDHSRDFRTDGVHNYFVTGTGQGEIQFKYDPTDDETVSPHGIDHLAVGVENTRSMFDRLTSEFGSTVKKEPVKLETTGSIIAFVTDPDGYTVELIESE